MEWHVAATAPPMKLHSCVVLQKLASVHLSFLGTDPVSSHRKPRFAVGDRVRVAWPPPKETTPPRAGTITEVVATNPPSVYRYRVTFPDGATETFFGFELEIEGGN
jgi:hypothetical protein